MPRPENSIASQASDELTRLVKALRKVRGDAGLNLTQLSKRCHYSVATLSTAASGKTVPRWETVWAFVTACDPNADETSWNGLWEAAKQAGTKASHNQRPAKGTDNTAAVPSPRSARPQGSRKPAWRGGSRGQADESTAAPNQPPVMPSESLLELLREAAETSERVSSGPRVPADPLRTALGLCTTSDDFVALLKQVRLEADLSIREISHRSESLSVPISRTSVADVLAGRRLPSTEQLHAFLLACGMPPEKTLIWHHTVTRLKISQIRHEDSSPLAVLRFTPERHQIFTMVIGLVLLVIQMVQVLGY
ncbi:helix-turn-helix transcriptional regulator [Streptomyces sp. Marseille-Q5077]|uniref:helix-turn-helix transcriptional regulator n=1 Tax=Streptomyces sp. Marseille-Q5077 TaxID=3418995 RepID=UPI003CFC5B6A